MPALTLKQARDMLWNQASPDIQATATAAQKLAVDTLLNQVSERCLTQGKPRGTIQTAQIAIYDNQITLPRGLETMLGWKTISGGVATCWGGPRQIFNRWFQFTSTQYPANYPFYCDPGLYDQGDGFVTFRELPLAGKVRITTTTTETTTTAFNVRGLSSGSAVYTGTGASRIEGENLTVPLVSGNSATSTTSFDAGNSLYLIFKPQTNGVVTFWLVPDNGSAVVQIGYYAPGETVPNYRRYNFPSATQQQIELIEMIAKRNYVPAVADNDYMIPSNIGALKMGLLALNFETAADQGRADTYWERCFGMLDGERQEFDGDSAVGAMEWIGDYGAGSIANTL